MKNTPFGTTRFDMYNFGGDFDKKINFEYLFDGFVFYEPIENFEIAFGIPHIFNDSSFVEEFYRRTAIVENISLNKAKSSNEIKEMINQFNVLKKENIRHSEYFKQVIEDLDIEIDKWIKN